MLTSKPSFAAMWTVCEVKTYRFHLGQRWWRKIQSLGMSKRYGKKEFDVSVFEENNQTVVFTTREIQRLFAFEFISNLPNDRRVETVLRLSARKLY